MRKTRVSDALRLPSRIGVIGLGSSDDPSPRAAAAAGPADAAAAAHRHGVSVAPSESLRPSPSLSHWQAQRPTDSARALSGVTGPLVHFTEITFSFSER